MNMVKRIYEYWAELAVPSAVWSNLVSSWILYCNKADDFMFVNLSKVIGSMTKDVKVLTLLIIAT